MMAAAIDRFLTENMPPLANALYDWTARDDG
jgi:hypothetical protein